VELNFVFIEDRPDGVELNLDHHSRAGGIQMSKPREENYSITDLEALHLIADVLWLGASTGACPP